MPPHPAATEPPPGYELTLANRIGYLEAQLRHAEERLAWEGERVRAEGKGRLAGEHGRHVAAMAINDTPCAGREDHPYPDDADLAQAWQEGFDAARALHDERANAAALHDLVELALDGGTMGPGWEEAARQALAGTAGAALLQERASWGETFRELGAKLEAARVAKEEAEAGARSLAGRLAVLLAERDADREAVRTLVQTLNGSLYVPTAVVEPLATLHARMAIWEEPATPLARAPDGAGDAPDDHEVDPMHAVAEDERGPRDPRDEEIDRRVAAVNRIAWLAPPIVAGPALAEDEEPSAGDVLEAVAAPFAGIIVGAQGCLLAEVRGGEVGVAAERVELRPGQSAEVVAIDGDVREAR